MLTHPFYLVLVACAGVLAGGLVSMIARAVQARIWDARMAAPYRATPPAPVQPQRPRTLSALKRSAELERLDRLADELSGRMSKLKGQSLRPG